MGGFGDIKWVFAGTGACVLSLLFVLEEGGIFSKQN